MSRVPHVIAQIEGRQAVWLTADFCSRQEVAGEAFNHQHVAAIFSQFGGRVGVPLVAWLAPEPENRFDPNAILVWVLGGRVGYLPRHDALFWQPHLREIQWSLGLPIACAAHIELPPEDGPETTLQSVLWMPSMTELDRPRLSRESVVVELDRAAAEPAARLQRAAIRRQGEQAAREAAQRETLTRSGTIEAPNGSLRAKVVEKQVNDGARLADLVARFGAEIAAKLMARELWRGQTREMIEAAFGTPSSVKEKVLKTKTKHALDFQDGEPCENCDGTGRVAEYAHYKDGRCFSCDGSGLIARLVLRVNLDNGVVVGWERWD